VVRLKVAADKCTGCRSCETACSLAHDGACLPDLGRIWIDFADHDTSFAPKICRQCRKPRCAAACPVGALEALPEGGVRLISEKCVGCGNCVSACPFRYLRLSHDGAPLICDLCYRRPEGPACARICQEDAITAIESPEPAERGKRIEAKGDGNQ
jgi:carbon-monoxide dehydrogenase iron sulfur subunit